MTTLPSSVPSRRRAAPGLPAAALVLAAAALLAACASPSPEIAPAAAPVESRSPVATAPAAPAGASPAAASGAAQSQVSTVDLAAAGSRGLPAGSTAAGAAALLVAPSARIVYFDFDSFAIRDEFKPLIEGHARVLVRDNARRLQIEGHTDDRGGREYNLALGQKRADAVLRSLVLLGVNEGQLEAVSYGEERPAASGSGEEAWSRNRRAELKDQ